jgi:hypothetical protein
LNKKTKIQGNSYKTVNTHKVKNLRIINKKAGEAVPEIVEELVNSEAKLF